MPKVEALKVGDPLDDDTESGRSSTPSDRERIEAWIDEAVDAGARRSLAGGGVTTAACCAPTAAGQRASRTWRSCCDEVFGPVVTVAQVSRPRRGARAGQRHATSACRLASSRTTCGRRCGPRRELEFGGVILNEAPTFRADQMPYGGVKESGYTREGPRFAVQEMTEPRMVVIQL